MVLTVVKAASNWSRRAAHCAGPRPYDIGRMAAARAFGVEGMDGAAFERADGVFDEAGFVERVGVDIITWTS